MTDERYGRDVLSGDWRRRAVVPVVAAEADLVVEDAASGFCGAVVELGSDMAGATVTLEDRHGRRRVFPMLPAAFLLEGAVTTLARPDSRTGPAAPRLTASGSLAVPGHQARVALPSRIYVEGVHDAELVERVWGDDLRIEGVAVEPLHGIDDLAAVVAGFRPAPGRRLGVLVDHLVPGSKESRIAAEVRDPNVKVVGHPYVDIWQAVKPSSLGIPAWPVVPKGRPWKDGVCAALGWGEPAEGWRIVRAAVRSHADLEPELLGRVEELIDFVTA
jgi:Protein of unknown function (DUF3097)